MQSSVRATALLALTLMTAPARAEEGGDEAGSDEADRPVGIGARRPRPPFQSPREVLSHSFDRLASTTTSLLEGVAGVSVLESLPLGGTLALRGLSGRRVAVLVDGLRLEDTLTPLGGDDLLGLIDPLSLRRVELLRGPGSVAIGPGALGGAIDLQRRHLTPDPKLAWDARGDLRAGFDGGRLGAFGRLAASGQLRGLGLQASVGLRQFGDLQSGLGGGREEFTAAADTSAVVEAAWAPRRGSHLRLGYELLRQGDDPRPDRSRWDHFELDRHDRDVVRFEYAADEVRRSLSAVRVDVRFRHQRLRRDLYVVPDDVIEGSRERVASLDAQLTLVSEVAAHRLSYGLDFDHDWVSSSEILEAIGSGAKAFGLSPLHPDGSRALRTEVFALDEMTLGPRLAVEVGARAGVASLAPGTRLQPAVPASSRSLPTYSSGLHARYLLGDGLNLVAGVGQGFLAPNLDDVASSGCHERGYRLPSPGLDPEKSLSAELGFKLDLYGVLTGTIVYAYTHLFDAMVETPREGTSVDCGGPQAVPAISLQNSTARLHSLDASVQLEFSRWNLISWMSWARGTREDGGSTLPFDRVPPLSGYAAARYHFTRLLSFLELALRWVAPQDRLGAADRLDRRLCSNPGGACAGSPSYFFLSLRGGMDLLRWLKLNLALENLTHERYRAYAAGVPAPGFSGLLGLEVSAP